MSRRETYPAGVPCWVESLQPDVSAAVAFYGSVLGWEFAGPGPVPGNALGGYYVARSGGADVAGIAPLPQGGPAAWMTHVRVESADATAELAAEAGGTVVAGPFDVPPAGRMAVLVDPGGALVCAWEPREREGAQRVNEPGAWSMSALQTGDPDGAAAFYGAVFGWQAEPFGPPEAKMALLRLPGYVGGEPSQPVPRDVVAVSMPPQGGDDARWSVDFWVDDADAAAAAADRLGGSIVVAPHDAPPFKQAVLADPAGVTFSISQAVTPPSASG